MSNLRDYAAKMKNTNCDCAGWAFAGGQPRPGEDGQWHHPNCAAARGTAQKAAALARRPPASELEQLGDAMIGDCECSPLGDIISTEGDCKEGELNVRQLDQFFKNAGSPAKWSPAVDTIMKTFADLDSKWTRSIPFSPVCGQIKALGQQAAILVEQIAADTGTAGPPGVKPPTSTVESVLKLGAAGLAVYAGAQLVKALKKG